SCRCLFIFCIKAFGSGKSYRQATAVMTCALDVRASSQYVLIYVSLGPRYFGGIFDGSTPIFLSAFECFRSVPSLQPISIWVPRPWRAMLFKSSTIAGLMPDSYQ